MKRRVMKEIINGFSNSQCEMIECASVVILEMCEAGEVCKCKDSSI